MCSVEQLHRLLEEKENDLHLAAELGKALLERNEQLTREHDKACSDHHQQLEVGELRNKKAKSLMTCTYS